MRYMTWLRMCNAVVPIATGRMCFRQPFISCVMINQAGLFDFGSRYLFRRGEGVVGFVEWD